MKRIIVLACGLGLLSGSIWAAQPILLQARTAGELAALCARPTRVSRRRREDQFLPWFRSGCG